MTQADKLITITHQLVGDISRLPGVMLDQGAEQQLVQLLTDAFEAVGLVALEKDEQQSGGYQPCRCVEYEVCDTCLNRNGRQVGMNLS